MNRPIILLGAGGHAKVLKDIMETSAMVILGVADVDSMQATLNFPGYQWLGGEKDVLKIPPESVFLVNGLGSIGTSNRRFTIYNDYKNCHYTFKSLIHSSAVVSINSKISEGVQVMAGAIIQPGSVIGNNVIVNTRVSVDHDCIIEDHVHLAPGVTLSGGITIGAGSHIGTGASVIQGIAIGKNCLVGAGAVVIHDIPDNAVVMGVPGKVTKYRSNL